MKIHLDTTSNIIKNPSIKKQIEDNLRQNFEMELPETIKRMGETSSFITAEVGFYSKLLNDAKECYRLGLYYATISMIGITAERFSIELSEKVEFKINEKKILEEDLFDKSLKQSLRLILLKKAEIIKLEIYNKLKEISEIRNKYVHPKEEGDAKKDSLKSLNLFIEIINSRFSDNYIIKEGKIVKK